MWGTQVGAFTKEYCFTRCYIIYDEVSELYSPCRVSVSSILLGDMPRKVPFPVSISTPRLTLALCTGWWPGPRPSTPWSHVDMRGSQWAMGILIVVREE